MSTPSGGRTWLVARAPIWRALADTVARARERRGMTVEDAQKVLDGYRSVARDLASARRQLPGSGIAAALEGVFASFHALVDRPPRNSRAAMLRWLRVDVPAVMATLRGPIIGVTTLFLLTATAGWWLIMSYPELIGLLAGEKMISKVEHGSLWTEGLLSITPASILSIKIFSNNIVVSITAFCAGIFYGLGTFYMIALNGLMLGGIFAFTHQHGLAGGLFEFVIAHGTVELSIICLAGAAGMALGESIARPRGKSRVASFRERTGELSKLLPVFAVLLIGCGLIEGYVSPNPSFPMASRVVIGICYWFVMLAALTGRLFGTPDRG